MYHEYHGDQPQIQESAFCMTVDSHIQVYQGDFPKMFGPLTILVDSGQ